MKYLLAILGLLIGGYGLFYAFRNGLIWPSNPSLTEFPVRILDVSHHQGRIAWAQVADAGYKFSYIKATEGQDWADPAFAHNRQEAQAAGVRWGAYHFLTFCSPPEAQAAHFLSVVGEEMGQLPPAVDIETGGNCAKTMDTRQLQKHLAQFLQVAEAGTGGAWVVYLIQDQLPFLFETLPNRPLWVRNIWGQPDLPEGQPWTLWQYHARGHIPGIDAFTDINVYTGTLEEFEAFLPSRRSP